MSARAMIRARGRAEARRRRRTGALAAASAASAAVGLLGAGAAADAATITVTNRNDAGAGSFRQAVLDANVTKAADTITFASNVTGTITLTSGGVNAKYDTTVDGPGADVLTIRATALSGNDVFSASNIASYNESQSIEVEGLTVVSEDYRALVAFTGIDNFTVRNCVLTGNSKFGGGGFSVLSALEANVINTTITGSTAETSGAGIFAENTKLTVTDSRVVGNTNQTDDPGGGIFATDTALTVVGSRIEGNQAPGSDGGGIAVFDPAGGKQSSLAVRNSSIVGNSALSNGGGIAAGVVDGPVTISGSTIAGNSALEGGGGIYAGYTGPVSVDSSTIAGNGAVTRGGGVWAFAPKGLFVVTNSTLTGNSAATGGGVEWTNYFDEPGAIRNSTIVDNSATTDGGGVYRYGFDGTGPDYEGPDNLVLTSTVVAGNTIPAPNANNGPDLGQRGVATGTFSTEFSLIGSTLGGPAITDAGGNKLNAGPADVGPLADNGGPTQTMAPLESSPLVDAGRANGLGTDGRGLTRTVNRPPADAAGSDGTDIGAVELADGEVIDAKASAKRKQTAKGNKVKIVVEAESGEAAIATADGTVKLGKKKVKLRSEKATLVAGEARKLTLKPASRKGSKQIVRALKQGKKGKAAVEVTIADGAGNIDTSKLKVTLSSGS